MLPFAVDKVLESAFGLIDKFVPDLAQRDALKAQVRLAMIGAMSSGWNPLSIVGVLLGIETVAHFAAVEFGGLVGWSVPIIWEVWWLKIGLLAAFFGLDPTVVLRVREAYSRKDGGK